MNKGDFDFGALVADQFKGVRQGYKFGKQFNEDKSIVRPAKAAVEVHSDDNAALKQAWNDGAAVKGIVEKEVKGGYEVTVAPRLAAPSGSHAGGYGQRAFCPFSQIDKFKKDASEYIGRKFEFLITEYAKDERGLNVIVSRRELMEIREAAQREATLAQLSEGETLNGTVTRVMDFGAFVDLGGIEGLIPAREVAWERVEDLNTVLKAGDGVTVKVMHIDREQQKISLSRKECLSRVFKRTPEEEAAAKSEAEVAEWMKANAEKNANVGSMAGLFEQFKV